MQVDVLSAQTDKIFYTVVICVIIWNLFQQCFSYSMKYVCKHSLTSKIFILMTRRGFEAMRAKQLVIQ